MGLLTLESFRQRLDFNLGNRNLDPTDLGYWINTGLIDITNEKELRDLKRSFSLTFAPGENNQTFTDIRGILGISNRTDEYVMLGVSAEAWEQLKPDATGRPQYWIRRAQQLLIWPTPDKETVIEGTGLIEHPPLAADSDRTLIPAVWDRAVLMFATHHAFADLDEDAKSTEWLRRARAYTDAIVEEDTIDGRATPHPVQLPQNWNQLQQQRGSQFG